MIASGCDRQVTPAAKFRRYRQKFGKGSMRAFEMPVEDLRLVRLAHVDPLLPAHPYVLYEYTVSQLTNRTIQALERRRDASQPVYTAHKGSAGKSESLEELYTELLAAIRLISSIYSHFLEPLRFAGANPHLIDRGEIFNGFARALVGSRILPSVEIVAANVLTLRALDRYQDRLGTDAARWMQYLAFEAMQTNVLWRGFTPGKELERLRTALRVIRDSSTILDRYQALARGSVVHGIEIP
jgi:hypothetical protein